MKEKAINIEIGNKIKDLRKSNGVKVNDLCNELGITASTYYFYESADRDIPISIVVKIAEFYNISVDDLIGHKVTYNRKNAVSFACFGTSADKKFIDQTNDEIILFEKDKNTIFYYVRTMAYNYGSHVLVNENEKTFPAVLTYDSNENLYTINNLIDGTLRILRPQYFKDNVLVIGLYAGTIDKNIELEQFF